jgi:glycosyltransferase involved in cell wall biosynthesis
MQIGTGLQNKLLEAMAMKLPCITSELANNSLNAGVNTEVLIGESPEEYANHVKILLKDELKSSILANKGHEFVINNYGWESSNAALSSLIKKTISK